MCKAVEAAKKTNLEELLPAKMELVASHCASIMTDKAPTVFKCGMLNGAYEVCIKERRNPEWPVVWDQVEITKPDGEVVHCGNRCGGRNTLARLYAEELLSLLQEA